MVVHIHRADVLLIEVGAGKSLQLVELRLVIGVRVRSGALGPTSRAYGFMVAVSFM